MIGMAGTLGGVQGTRVQSPPLMCYWQSVLMLCPKQSKCLLTSPIVQETALDLQPQRR